MKCDIIAHRGYCAIAPENTFSAFQKAIEKGANGVEFDLQLSLDRYPVIIHDSTVDRVSKGKGKVRELSLKDLKKLEVGSWFNEEFTGEKIPTLPEVLSLFSPHNLRLYVEVKECDYWQDQDISNLLDLLLASNRQNSIYLISFDFNFLHRVRQQSSTIFMGYNVKSKEDYIKALEMGKLNQINCISSEYHILLENPFLIKKSHENQINVVAWTVDDQAIMNQLKQLNLQAIITNKLLPI
jgi:glycerophosphoryl diester phosphodiesterase